MKAMDLERNFELTLSFNRRAAMGRFLGELWKEPNFESTILRSRMTPFGGWVRISLSGSARSIERFLGPWEDAIVTQARSA